MANNQTFNKNSSVLFLRAVGNYDEVPSEILNNPNRVEELSEFVFERTQSTNTFKILKGTKFEPGIYYHKDILEKVLQEKSELVNENESLKQDLLKKGLDIISYQTKLEQPWWKLIFKKNREINKLP